MIFNESKNSFFLGNIENPDAIIRYDENEDIVIISIFVSEQLRGQGIAQKLLNKVIDLALSKNKKIIPICSYAKEKLRDLKYKDIVKI